MRKSMMYVRFEPISTAYVTMGIDPIDMLSTANVRTRHILILPPVTDELAVNQHTGMNVIDGLDNVRSFLESDAGKNVAWLDYKAAGYVDDLLPQEIAELLYLGHRRTHLVLPFYYKLKNEYARIPMRSGLVNSYWRHPEQFESVLSSAINRHLQLLLAQQPFWLRGRKQRTTAPVPSALQKQWGERLADGVMFDWKHAKVNSHEVLVPMCHISERQLILGADDDDLILTHVGQLALNRATSEWRVVFD